MRARGWIAALPLVAACSVSEGTGEIGGFIGVARVRGNVDEFGGAAFFLNAAVSFPDREYPSLVVEECVDSPGFGTGATEILDAGDFVDIAGPAGTLSLPLVDPQDPFYEATGPTSDYVSGGAYSATIDGGPDVKSQTLDITAPVDFSLDTPSFGAPLALGGTDLAITWTSAAAGGGDVFVAIEQESAGGEDLVDRVCRFADDGAAAIPSAELALPTGAGETQSISVFRHAFVEEDPRGADGAIGLRFRVIWSQAFEP